MQSSDYETVRRVLSGVLDRLEADSQTDSDSVSPGMTPTSEARPAVILVVLGNSDSKATAPEEGQTIIENGAVMPGGGEQSSTHPGLEKFSSLENGPSRAPKSCFMEPDRACVNSGACEMRGY